RGAARVQGRALRDPLPRAGRQRARQAAQEHPARAQGPADLHRVDRAGGDRDQRRDRRRSDPRLDEPRALGPVRAAPPEGLPEGGRRQVARELRRGALRHLRDGRGPRALPDAGEGHARALHRRHGRARQELLQRLREAARLRGGRREDPGPLPVREEGRGDGRGAGRAGRLDRAARPEGADPRPPRGLEGVAGALAADRDEPAGGAAHAGGARALARKAMDRERIVALDKRRVWHPYTAMDEYAASVDPLVVVRAEGARLYDADGRSYLDANASWWVAALGHGHPRLVAALERQARAFPHVSLAGVTHAPAAELAEALCARAPRAAGRPGLERVFYSDDGSTAVEVALKLALQYWAQSGRPERRAFVALEGGFHGETLGCTAIGGVEVFRRPFAGSLAQAFHVPSPGDPARSLDEAGGALEALLARAADRIAAAWGGPTVPGAARRGTAAPAHL